MTSILKQRAGSKRGLTTSTLLLVSTIFSGCSAIPEKNIHTTIDIEAPRETVWSILVDNPAYPEWNPYHVRVNGEMIVGSKLDLEIEKPNGETVRISPRVMRLRAQKELIWGGGIPGIFHGEHVFLLASLDASRTRLVH